MYSTIATTIAEQAERDPQPDAHRRPAAIRQQQQE